jgi:hypothetical protein
MKATVECLNKIFPKISSKHLRALFEISHFLAVEEKTHSNLLKRIEYEIIIRKGLKYFS